MRKFRGSARSLLSAGLLAVCLAGGSPAFAGNARYGEPCTTDQDCGPGLGCFRDGPITYCTVPPPDYPAEERRRDAAAKSCHTDSDCGSGDWICAGGSCVARGKLTACRWAEWKAAFP